MSDNELDNLFKEAADGFNVPRDPSAWESMAKKLDQAGTATAFWNWKTISSTTLVGITGAVLIWYFVSGYNEPSKELSGAKFNNGASLAVPAQTPAQADQKDSEKNNTITAKDNTKESTLEHQSITESNQVVTPANEKAERVHVKTIGITKLSALPGQPKVLPENKTESGIKTAANPELLSPAQAKTEPSRSDVMAPALVVAASDKSQLSANQTSLLPTDEVRKDSLLKPDEQKPLAKKDSANEDIIKKPARKKFSTGPAFSVKLAVAPDYSSINYFDADDAGINYGVLLGYSFNSRWSVYTGVISSRKIYTTDEISEAYTNPSGHDYPVTKLDGDCRVLDIPLNVYYTFYPERSFSIKAGIGFSSYMMMSEDYVYSVETPYGPHDYKQNVDHENNEWFKVMNVSVILQKRLSNRFSLELEPFLKAPLTGVGEGEVSLVSLGAFFNLRFDIPIHKQDDDK